MVTRDVVSTADTAAGVLFGESEAGLLPQRVQRVVSPSTIIDEAKDNSLLVLVAFVLLSDSMLE